METDIFTPLLWRCVKKYMQTKRRHTVFQDSEDGIKFQHLSTFHTRVTQPRGGGGTIIVHDHAPQQETNGEIIGLNRTKRSL